jgi:outer membrane protein TolC
LLATAFERNPRLKSMEADVRAAEARIVQAQKSKVPDFSLGVMTDVKASPVMVRPLAEVTLPIWRDKIAAEIAQARASSRAAQARLSNEQIMLAADFAMKTYSYRELTRRLVLLRQQLIPKARQSLQIARSGYLSGQIDFFNLIDSQQKLLAFQLAEVDARTEREMVLAELSLMIAGVPPEGAPLRTTEKSKH